MKIYFVIVIVTGSNGLVLEVKELANPELHSYKTLNEYVVYLRGRGYTIVESFEKNVFHLKERSEYQFDEKNNPEQLWEYTNIQGDNWRECIPDWQENCLYRRKKKTQTVWYCMVLNKLEQRMPIVCYEDSHRNYKNNIINWKEYLESIFPTVGEIQTIEI